jgi:23S rRNA pseudouridine1911/1915/1917 synthase
MHQMTLSRELVPEVLFEDTHILVISKPAGLLAQGDISGDPTVVDWARTHVGRNYVGLVHRLDRNTSGIMILGKRSKSADRLTQSLQSGKLNRIYFGLVEGSFTETQTWTHFLSRDESTRVTQVQKTESPSHKIARLKATPLSSPIQWKQFTITPVEFVLETGRTHQIRAQASFENFPLVGDLKYGAQTAKAFPRPALHSWKLECPHPMTHEPVQYTAPIPNDLQALVPKLRLT